MEDNKIGLVMVVKNESHVIKRCFDSLLPLIDEYLICDTGSSEEDGTPNIIRNYMKEKGIPGEVIFKEWENFGANKSYLLKKAHKKMKCEYIVFIDADEVFLTPDHQPITSADKEKLLSFGNARPDVGIFYWMTHYGNLRYKRWQMIRNNQLYWWKYPFHEILLSTRPCGSAVVPFIINHARQEGSNSIASDKWKKYVRWGLEWLEKEPNDERMTFYLAQSYGDGKDYDNALIWYQKRSEMTGGYYQEVYISLLRMARIYISRRESHRAIEKLTLAIQKFPRRLEAFYELMLIYDSLNRYQEAFFFGKSAPFGVSPPLDDLFIEHEIYTWKHQFRLGVVGYYVDGERPYGRRLIEDLLERKVVPANDINFVKKQLQFFLTPNEDTLWNGLTNYKDRKSIIIMDNFLEDPDKVRNFALQQEFSVKGNYPGLRTKSFATQLHKKLFEQLLNRKIIYWPETYNGCFQYVKEDSKTWWHRDLTDYSAILYLSPNAPPDAGTSIYQHKKLGATYATPLTSDELSADSNNPDAWKLVDQIGNRYNRLVLFDGRMSHRANGYFGKTKEDARLFQIFFFDVERV